MLEPLSDLNVKWLERPRILCVVDGPNWIFNRHAVVLQQMLGDEFNISIGYRFQEYDEDDYDMIYPLEFNMVKPEQIKKPEKYVTGIRSLIAWAENDFLVLVNFLNTHFQSVHVVTQELYDIFSPYIADLMYVTHGVDTDFFSPIPLERPSSDILRVGWAGNSKTVVKGFRDYIQPLDEVSWLELVYCGYSDRNLDYEEMPGFYASIDAYICASSYEGNNNGLLEAAAMEKAIVTTPVGTVSEYLENNLSALIVERDLEQFKTALQKLHDNPDLIYQLGQKARGAILEGRWDWKSRAEDYRQFFRRALRAKGIRPEERIAIEPGDNVHFAGVLTKQFLIIRELRIDCTLQKMGVDEVLKHTEQELNHVHQEWKIARQTRETAKNKLEETLQRLDINQGELEIRQEEITSLQQNLATTQQDLTTTQQDLTTTQQDLVTTQQDLVTTQQDLTTTQQDLVTTQQDLVTTQQDLVTTQQDLVTTQQDLVTTQQDLVTTQQDLTTTQQDLVTTQQDLTTSQQMLAAEQQETANVQQELESTRFEIELIKSSETYRVAEFVKWFWPVKAVIWLYSKYKAWRNLE